MGNQKNEKISLAGPSSMLRGRLTIFLALSEGLRASVGDEELTLPFGLLTALAVGWTCHYFISLWCVANGQQAVMAAEGILEFHQRFSKTGRGPVSLLSLPPSRELLLQFILTYLDLKRKHLGLQ